MSAKRLENADVLILCDALEEQRERSVTLAEASAKRGNARVASTRRHMAERCAALREMLINARFVDVVDYSAEQPKTVVDEPLLTDLSPESVIGALEQMLTPEVKLKNAIALFPARFGMRRFPGDVFRISTQDSYVGDNGEPILYTERLSPQTESYWLAFAKGTVAEVRREVVDL